ncbi:MAG: metallophosphoesterase [Salinivirgaceae bacterium]|nr:metallophosphoesterase [Salinivirgaceae bacterium]
MKYAIISDIHEDVVNLRLAFNKIEKLGCDEIICLGDISGFSARNYDHYDIRNASECLHLVRENCKIIIAGNHDLHSARKTPENSILFSYPHDWYALDYPTKKDLSKSKVWLYDADELDPLFTSADKEFLKSIPEVIIEKVGETSILFTHYIYPNVTGSAQVFYSEIDEFDLHKSFMKENECHVSFSGHQHYLGLLIASENMLVKKRYNRKYLVKEQDVVLVPPVIRNKYGSGICIFDTTQKTIEAKRI